MLGSLNVDAVQVDTNHFLNKAHAPVHILLVEDATSDALLLRAAITASGVPFYLQQLFNGNDVLPLLHEKLSRDISRLPDLILLDLGLPQIDGFQLLEDLAHAPSPIRSIPIIILTGYEDFDYIRDQHNLPISAYLTKPCKAEQIRDILLSIQRGKSTLAVD